MARSPWLPGTDRRALWCRASSSGEIPKAFQCFEWPPLRQQLPPGADAQSPRRGRRWFRDRHSHTWAACASAASRGVSRRVCRPRQKPAGDGVTIGHNSLLNATSAPRLCHVLLSQASQPHSPWGSRAGALDSTRLRLCKILSDSAGGSTGGGTTIPRSFSAMELQSHTAARWYVSATPDGSSGACEFVPACSEFLSPIKGMPESHH